MEAAESSYKCFYTNQIRFFKNLNADNGKDKEDDRGSSYVEL